jgi:hypothetical protein
MCPVLVETSYRTASRLIIYITALSAIFRTPTDIQQILGMENQGKPRQMFRVLK